MIGKSAIPGAAALAATLWSVSPAMADLDPADARQLHRLVSAFSVGQVVDLAEIAALVDGGRDGTGTLGFGLFQGTLLPLDAPLVLTAPPDRHITCRTEVTEVPGPPEPGLGSPDGLFGALLPIEDHRRSGLGIEVCATIAVPAGPRKPGERSGWRRLPWLRQFGKLVAGNVFFRPGLPGSQREVTNER